MYRLSNSDNREIENLLKLGTIAGLVLNLYYFYHIRPKLLLSFIIFILTLRIFTILVLLLKFSINGTFPSKKYHFWKKKKKHRGFERKRMGQKLKGGAMAGSHHPSIRVAGHHSIGRWP